MFLKYVCLEAHIKCENPSIRKAEYHLCIDTNKSISFAPRDLFSILLLLV